MTIDGLVQSIIGILGIGATLLVARLVLRLERRDRAKEKVAERAEATAAEERRQAAEDERERRAIRREQHKEDYAAATRALNVISAFLDSRHSQPRTREEFAQSGILGAAQTLEEIADNIPTLRKALRDVWSSTIGLTLYPFPDPIDLRYAERTSDSERAEQEHGLIRRAIQCGIAQDRWADMARKALEQARKAVSEEWGSG